MSSVHGPQSITTAARPTRNCPYLQHDSETAKKLKEADHHLPKSCHQMQRHASQIHAVANHGSHLPVQPCHTTTQLALCTSLPMHQILSEGQQHLCLLLIHKHRQQGNPLWTKKTHESAQPHAPPQNHKLS